MINIHIFQSIPVTSQYVLAYYNQGKYAEAELLFKRALAIDEKALGTNHPDVARDLSESERSLQVGADTACYSLAAVGVTVGGHAAAAREVAEVRGGGADRQVELEPGL